MQTFNTIFQEIIKKNWQKEALADYGTDLCYTYGQFSKEISKLHTIFDICGVERGDKIAVLGKNSSHWIVTYFATITKGAVIVPILDEFNPKDVLHILNHSEPKLFFCDKWFLPKIEM